LKSTSQPFYQKQKRNNRLEANENKIPDWLKNLQENSWELELLVSGGAIFSLIQLSDLYINWINTLRITTHLPGAGFMIISGVLGIKILTTGFILHLIMRAYWLGMVCINYVYPNGINADKLNQAKPFKSSNTNGDLKDQIMKIDKYCGTVMFTSIISAVAITSLSVLFCLIIFLIMYLETSFGGAILDWIFTLLIIQFLFYVADLLLMGILRKIPFLSYLFFPFFKVFDFFSFRKFYQRPLNLFSSNVPKLKFFIRAFIFTIVSIVSTYLAIYRTMHWPNSFDSREYKWNMADGEYMAYANYRDQITEKDKSRVSIQSKIISSNFLDVFVLYERRFDFLINATETPDSLKTFASITGVQIDDSTYNDVSWSPYWNSEITNIGINAMLDITHLSNGKHILRVFTKSDQIDPTDLEHLEQFETSIPFWKDVR
jgi:hypothetical protein